MSRPSTLVICKVLFKKSKFSLLTPGERGLLLLESRCWGYEYALGLRSLGTQWVSGLLPPSSPFPPNKEFLSSQRR